jgi:hypothetical protein
MADDDDDGDLASPAYYDVNDENDGGRRRSDICDTTLDEWTRDIRTHLSSVIRSGIVGLFDTPYPYLSNQVLDMAAIWRTSSPMIALTERDPRDWATSRLRNHGVLLCRKEYSLGGMGSSEFDLIGCHERASSLLKRRNDGDNDDAAIVDINATGVFVTPLNFWDVFRYRSHRSEDDPSLRLGMERQMMRHQELYLPMAQFAPDIFGVRSSRADEDASSKRSISDEDMAIDIRRHILDGTNDADGHDVPDERRTTWRDVYSEPLTCRGRVNWIMESDTMEEYYHIPKTCVDGVSSSTEERDVIGTDPSKFRMIPLIPYN